MSGAAIPRPPGDVGWEPWQCHAEVWQPEGVTLVWGWQSQILCCSVPPLSWVDLRQVHPHWWHSRVAAPGKRIEEPQTSCLAPRGTLELPCSNNFHTCNRWSQPQAFTLCTPSITALMCPLQDRGTCNTVFLMWTNVYTLSGPSSASSINFWAASTRVNRQP